MINETKQLIFVVSIKYPSILEDRVIQNYVQMSLKKYHKLCRHMGTTDWFGGIFPSIQFKILEVSDISPQDIRATIKQINDLSTEFDIVEKGE
jgi:hypothetical protein